MNNILKHILICSLLLTMTIGCASSSAKKTVGISERGLEVIKLPLRNTVDREAYNYFINGSIFETIGEYQLANMQYEKALQIYPQSDEIRKAYASTFYVLNNYKQALDQALKVKERDLDTWLLLSNCYGVLGNIDSLVGAYHKIVELDSLNVEAFYRLGLYYKEENNLDSAIWAFDHLSKISSTFRVYLQLGNFQILAGRYDDAEKSYLNSLALDSSEENIRSYLGLSAIYENRGEMEKAVTNLALAAERAPGDIQIQNRLLQFYQHEDKRLEAVSQARKLDSLLQTDFSVKHQLAMMLYDVDSLETADSLFNYMLNEGDSAIVIFYYLGRISIRNEKYDTAENNFKILTQKADSIVDGWLNLGMVYRATEATEKELETYNSGLKFMKSTDDSAAILFSKAVMLERNGQFDSSVVTFEQLLRMIPEHGQSLNYLGYMLADKDVRLEEAKDLIERALAISPDNGAYLDSYGWVLFKLGDTEKALENLLLAYEQIKTDPVVVEHIGDVYQALNKPDEAKDYWNKALELDPDNTTLKEKLNR
ncbi:MAG: tetratricopeptide repeat protein [Candidatus Zixiibacteriota bacterium]